jgi:hypothetical protein
MSDNPTAAALRAAKKIYWREGIEDEEAYARIIDAEFAQLVEFARVRTDIIPLQKILHDIDGKEGRYEYPTYETT